MSVLPLGWAELPLSELAEVRLGRQRAPMNHSGDQMRPYLRAANVGWDGLQLDDVKSMNFTDHEMATYRLAPGDLLLSEASGSAGEVGKPALWNGEVDDCAFQNTLLRVRAHGMEPRFLLHYFGFVALTGRFVEHSRGVGIHHLGRARLASWPTPKPPADEQRRIVDILEGHLSRLDAGGRYLSDGLQRTRRWAAGVADLLLWEPGWPTHRLGTLLREPMRNGRSDRVVTGSSSGIRTLTLTAVTRNEFCSANTKLTTTGAEVARELWLEPGDIFVQRANTPELVGTAALFNGPKNWAIFPDLLIRLRADEDLIHSRFLVAALRSERSHRSLRAKAKGLAGSMPKVDQTTVAAIDIPLPPLSHQRTIIEELEKTYFASTALATSLRSQEQRSNSLRRALLQAAFSGKLTGRHTDIEVIEELAGV